MFDSVLILIKGGIIVARGMFDSEFLSENRFLKLQNYNRKCLQTFRFEYAYAYGL
jgi:hypothetical protein